MVQTPSAAWVRDRRTDGRHETGSRSAPGNTLGSTARDAWAVSQRLYLLCRPPGVWKLPPSTFTGAWSVSQDQRQRECSSTLQSASRSHWATEHTSWLTHSLYEAAQLQPSFPSAALQLGRQNSICTHCYNRFGNGRHWLNVLLQKRVKCCTGN